MIIAPVVFFIFNRPKLTKISFEAIKQSRPEILFIVADGPRASNRDDEQNVHLSRAIVEDIDWPCKVYKNFSSTNLGCRWRINTGLDWVFQHVDSAIIIEDDCLPSGDFFNFCTTLLEHHKNSNFVGTITGSNFQDGFLRNSSSYYYSKHIHVWGWATWKKTWLLHDKNISFWPTWKLTDSWISLFTDNAERRYWEYIFDLMYENKIDTWDFAFICSNWFNGKVSAVSNFNLVTNIGFGPDGTHTRNPKSRLANRPFDNLSQIFHPTLEKIDLVADEYFFSITLEGRNLRFPRNIVWIPYRNSREFASKIKYILKKFFE
jgi:hypothetical protein